MSGITITDLLCRKRKVMETCLGGDFHATGAGFSEKWDYFHCREVDDVQVEIGRVVRKRKDFFDRASFEGRGAGV